MKASEIYKAQPIKVDTFADNIVAINGVVTAWEEKHFDNGKRIVLTLDEGWTLIVNDTAYRIIKAAHGDETNDWIGRPLTAYKGKSHYRGDEKDSVCVRIPEEPAPPLSGEQIDAANSELQKAATDDLTDDIPF